MCVETKRGWSGGEEAWGGVGERAPRMAEVASDSTAGISGHACCSIWTKWWDRRSGCADACAASQMPAPFGGKRSGRLPAPPHERFSIRDGLTPVLLARCERVFVAARAI